MTASLLHTSPHVEDAANFPLVDRRNHAREQNPFDVWLIDHSGSTILHCKCLDSSSNGLFVRAPLGYAIAEGRRYEVSSHPPQESHWPGFDFVKSRTGTVVRTEMHVNEGAHYVGVGIRLD
jgi:hypothetical protein